MIVTRPSSLAGGALIALLALWMACFSAPASAGGGANSSSTPAIARVSASEEEAEEGEEELEEGAEEAATAEVEAEEGESTSGRSISDHAGAGGAVLSGLKLTAHATDALRQDHPSASAIGFSFTLSAPSKVRITLVEQTADHGHDRWSALPDSLTVNAGQGRFSHSLDGHNRLAPGRYRLTVKPLEGRSRSIYLRAQR